MRWRKTWSKMRSLQSDHFQRAFTARARARADLKVKPETMIFKDVLGKNVDFLRQNVTEF